MRYEVLCRNPETGERFHLQPVIKSLQWEEQPGQLAQRVTVEFLNLQTPIFSLDELICIGNEISIHADWGEGWVEVISRAIIWNRTFNASDQTCSLTAYDPLIYLAKSKYERFFPGGTDAKDVLRAIFDELQVPFGKLDGPNVPLGRFAARGTIADTIQSIFDAAWRNGDHRYAMQWRDDSVHVTIPGYNEHIFYLDENANVVAASYEQDLADFVTEVVVTGSTSPEADESEDELMAHNLVTHVVEGRTEFGHLREILHFSDEMSEAAAIAEAQAILEARGGPVLNRSFSAIDLPWLRKGDLIRIKAGRLDQHFLIAGISHDATSRTMQVQIDDSGSGEARQRRVIPSRGYLLTS